MQTCKQTPAHTGIKQVIMRLIKKGAILPVWVTWISIKYDQCYIAKESGISKLIHLCLGLTQSALLTSIGVSQNLSSASIAYASDI